MGSLSDIPVDQVDSIGVDVEVNNLSDEHFRDVMEELTNHQIPERDKCPLVRRLNASISGYFKSTGDVGLGKIVPVKTNNNNNTHRLPEDGNVDNGNSIELIEYRRTFEYKNYQSPKNCDVNSLNSATLQHSSSSSSQPSSSTNVDSFVNFDSLKCPPHELINDNITISQPLAFTMSTHHNNTTETLNNNNNNSNNNEDTTNQTNTTNTTINNNTINNNNNNANSNNDANNNAKGTRNGKDKKKKAKDEKLYKTIYTAQDIDGHIGDKSIDDLVYYVTGNKKVVVDTSVSPIGVNSPMTVTNVNNAVGSTTLPASTNTTITTTTTTSTTPTIPSNLIISNNNPPAPLVPVVNSAGLVKNIGGKVKKKEKSFTTTALVVNQGRKKGSNNNNNNGYSSSCGKSIPRSSSATTFDSKFSSFSSSSSSSSSVAQSSRTSPSLSKSHSIESSSSFVTSIQQQPQQPVTHTVKSKVKEFHAAPTTHSNNNINDKNSQPLVTTTANRDLENKSFKELQYAASDPETADQETSFQPVKSKHLKRRKTVSRNKNVCDLRTASPSPRSSNTIFTTSSSSTSTIPSVTSSVSNSVNISMNTSRGYESEREYCADEYRRRKDYLKHRKLASSMPHSEQNSADNSDIESSCSYPVSGRMPILPTPPGPPASSNNSISSTPKVSYADIAKMGSVIAVTPPVVITGNDDNNNVNENASNCLLDSGLSPSNSCSPYPSSSPDCLTSPPAVAIRPKDFAPTTRETKKETNNTNTNTNKNDKKSDQSTSSFSSPPLSSSPSSNTTINSSSSSPPQVKSTSSLSSKAKTVTKCALSSTANSKTLEALLSPPAEKTPTFDMKTSNKLSDTRIASIKSDTLSRASMLKKSYSIPGANVKNNNISSYRVTSSESTNRSTTKLPNSLPPVIMNDDSDATDEIESSFTFGFFDDTISSSLPATTTSKTTTTTITATKTSSTQLSPSPSSPSSSKNSSLNFTIKPMSSSASIKPSSSATKPSATAIKTSTSASATIKSTNPVVMTSRSLNSSIKSTTTTTTVKNNDSLKNANSSSSSVSHVKSTKNASTTNLTHLSATSSSNTNTVSVTSNLAKTTADSSKSSEATNELPQGKKVSGKDSKSPPANNNGNASLQNLIAIKLAEPPITMDADINTFNYNQIINFIKNAWESVMCQYHRPPQDNRNNSQSSSSTSSSTSGANLFRESTSYYKELISP